jgi:hypothetical protein
LTGGFDSLIPHQFMPRFDIVPEYEIPAPTNKNRVWLTKDGAQKAGVESKVETDLDRIRKERESVEIEVIDTDARR